MSTDPQIKGENIWAAIKGGLASTLALFVILIVVVFTIPSTPEDDGHIRGAVMFVGVLPLVFGFLFLYYLVLSVKVNRPFKFAMLVQTILIMSVSIFVFYLAYKSVGLWVAVVNAIYTFCFFSVAGVFGAWAWSKKKH